MYFNLNFNIFSLLPSFSLKRGLLLWVGFSIFGAVIDFVFGAQGMFWFFWLLGFIMSFLWSTF